jgi:hypothetical protein
MRHRPTPCNHCGNHTRQNSPRADATQNGQHPIHIHTHLHLVGILPSHSTPQPEPFTQTHGKNLAHYIHRGGSLPTLYIAHHMVAPLPQYTLHHIPDLKHRTAPAPMLESLPHRPTPQEGATEAPPQVPQCTTPHHPATVPQMYAATEQGCGP